MVPKIVRYFTRNLRSSLILSELIGCLAGVFPEAFLVDIYEHECVFVSSLVDEAVPGVDGLAVVEPGDLSMGRSVHHAHHLGLVPGTSVDERLLLLNRRFI